MNENSLLEKLKDKDEIIQQLEKELLKTEDYIIKLQKEIEQLEETLFLLDEEQHYKDKLRE